MDRSPVFFGPNIYGNPPSVWHPETVIDKESAPAADINLVYSDLTMTHCPEQ